MASLDRLEDNDSYANKIMQAHYPGPYTIECYFNSKIGGFGYRLKFEDPKEQTLWLLKYSDR